MLLQSIEPRHLTNKSHPRALWATGVLLIVKYYIHHIIINTHVDDDVMAQNMICPVGTPVNNLTVALPTAFVHVERRLLAPIWFDHIFRSMIFGQVMAKIRNGGGSRTVAFRPFGRLFGVFVILGVTYAGGPKNERVSFYQ